MTISDVVNAFLYTILFLVAIPSIALLIWIGVAMIGLLLEMLRGMSQ